MKQPPTEERRWLTVEKDGFDMRSADALPERKDVGFVKAKAQLDWTAPEKRVNE